MEAKDLVLDALGRVHRVLQRTLNGLTLDELHRQPHPESNTIAWLAWHLTRVQDVAISGLAELEQAWISQAWHAKFDMAADPDQDGFGHTPEQVTGFRVASARVLLEYHESVLERSKTYVSGLSPEAFDRELNQPQFQPLPTVGMRLVSVISDNLQHAGQAAYLRGLFQGRGW